MTNRFLKTKIPVANLDKVERLKEQLGREPEDHEIEISFAEIVIDLYEVEAVRQSFKDDELVEHEASVYLRGEIFYCQTPYPEVLAQWLALFEDDVMQGAPIQDVGQAVRILARALDEDRAEGSLYYGYQSNIAQSFVSAWENYVNGKGPLGSSVLLPKPGLVQELSNEGARNFLELLINSTK